MRPFAANTGGVKTADPGLQSEPTRPNYTWDEFDNLVEIDGPLGVLANAYDADRIRKHKAEDDGTTLDAYYSGLVTASEVLDAPPPGGSVPFSYLMGHQLLGLDQNGAFFYFLSDWLGTVRVLVDGSGGEAASYVHAEFGQNLASTEIGGSSSKTFLGALSSHNELATAALFYMRRRWYDPDLGRFLKQDPIGFAGGWNLYAYTWNNPVNLVDVGGLEPAPPTLTPFPPVEESSGPRVHSYMSERLILAKITAEKVQNA